MIRFGWPDEGLRLRPIRLLTVLPRPLTAPLPPLTLSLVGAMILTPPPAFRPASRVVVPRRVLVVLVFALPVLVVAFGVLMGGAMLAQATLDEGGALALRWTAAAALMLLIVDLVLLIGALGWNAVSGRDGSDDRPERRPDNSSDGGSDR